MAEEYQTPQTQERKPRIYGFQETLDVLASGRTDGKSYLQYINSGSLDLRTDVIFPKIPKRFLRVST